MPRIALVVLAAVLAGRFADAAGPAKRFVYPAADGRLIHVPDSRGNCVPDFSHAGYGGGAAIPNVPVRVVVPAGVSVQTAIDHVSGLAPDANGFRGAVLLRAGRHEVTGQLTIGASAVVLRGQEKDTVLVATGTDRRALIRICGRADRADGKPRAVADEYVPVGADTLRLDSADGLKVGDAVTVEHPGTKEWIAAVGMDRFPSRDRGSYLDWRPGTVSVRGTASSPGSTATPSRSTRR